MNPEKEIKDLFEAMQSKKDFVALLNKVREILYGPDSKVFYASTINPYIVNNNTEYKYTSFTITKKSGASRTIHAPKNTLKTVQTCLNYILQVVYKDSIHACATGFIPGRSIVQNAQCHTNKHYVYNIDLKDFFPSIDKRRVYFRLQEKPFNLIEEKSFIANMIAMICCHEMEVERYIDGQWFKKKQFALPQGAPTSPMMSNVVCNKLDQRLARAAKNHGVHYTRYADDITFSSMHNVYQKNSDFILHVEKIIREQHFHIKESKTRLQKQGYKQEVTGLFVNEKVNVPTRYIKQIRHWIYFWEKYGKQKTIMLFLNSYILDKGYIKKGTPNMENVIWGKLEYLKMVKGEKNSTYLKLKERFENLIRQSLGEVIDLWEKEGIQKAMKPQKITWI
ncbi:MAG: reverse transcriptase domain-containing protein [Saprospiraceae bacterium]